MSITAVALNAASALDRTHDIGERGPKTYQARARLAKWLDTGRGNIAKVRADIASLRQLAQVLAQVLAQGGAA